ncbi:interleukin-3 receptor subunit alpha isoform X2 [Hyaena hyaena]|uniref:interleukin-3 receptor subunit alpha isoform X2 n=1 Tax=Hyaena hyaena TaxID=95912 RepID=UPI0019235445|nr:interleukin-3 receptor subunit alpha isoform X2 [Hyaena hyaena]
MRDRRKAADLRQQGAGSRIAMRVVWLALCLTPVSRVLPAEQDADLPIKNLRMEPETRRLTWDLNGNVSEIKCFINSQEITQAVNRSFCEFYVLPLCAVSNFTVASSQAPAFSVWTRYPPPAEGNPEAAAQRLGCWVHGVDFLTCSWEAGRAAPRDLQYHLTYEMQECPRYEVDVRGTRVRCHFAGVSRLGGHIQVLVNGSSRGASIPCSERTVELADVERLTVPNITGTCNKSYSIMEWKVSSHFNHRFTYELEIQKGTDPPYTEKPRRNYYVLPNPGNYAVRLRVQLYFRRTWSEWGAPQRFDCDVGDDGHFRDWLTSSLILLGSLLSLGLGVALCGRYSLLRRLFPPIPHMKDPISDNLQSSKVVAWEASRASGEDCQVAEVQVLGET